MDKLDLPVLETSELEYLRDYTIILHPVATVQNCLQSKIWFSILICFQQCFAFTASWLTSNQKGATQSIKKKRFGAFLKLKNVVSATISDPFFLAEVDWPSEFHVAEEVMSGLRINLVTLFHSSCIVKTQTFILSAPLAAIQMLMIFLDFHSRYASPKEQ